MAQAPKGCGLHSGRGDPHVKRVSAGVLSWVMCAKDLPPSLFEGQAFRGCEVQPFLFVTAMFLYVLCGSVCNLQPLPGWENHVCEFAMSLVSWLCAQRQIGACSGVCMSDIEKAG